MDLRTIAERWYIDVITSLPNLLLIAVILVLTIVVSRRSQGVVRRLSARTQAPREIGDLLGRMVRIGVLLVGVLLVLTQLGFGQAVISFVAGLGIAGIIVGFALQDIVKHFAAGVLLLMLRPFRIGDEVRIGQFTGRIVDVQLRATVLKTEGGDEVLIPNADVYNSAVVNMSRYDLHRHSVVLQVPDDLDLERARAALVHALGDVPGVVGNPQPSVVATGLDGTAATIEARFWVDERVASSSIVTTEVITTARRALEQARAEAEGGAATSKPKEKRLDKDG
jgi:small-conductance mechanosensitive channel